MSKLDREIQLAATEPRWAGNAVTTVYFGGGTPSLHTPDEIARLLSTSRRCFPFADDVEITLEANPGTLSESTLAAWRVSGVNRLSLGAQSFSPRKLSVLYRDHSVAEIYEAVKASRTAGFTNVSLDLIFGLPDETLEEWKNDLRAALELQPQHISLYNLEYHENTLFFRWRQSGRIRPLSEDFEAEMFLITHCTLVENGFEHYEVSNFARPGFRSRHNSAYWEGKPYLGLGPSAHSFDGRSLRRQNVADLKKYSFLIDAGKLPIENESLLTAHEIREEWISLSLRKSEGISWNNALRRLGEENASSLWSRARELPAHLISFDKNRLALTGEGWFRENSILLFLFESLNPSASPEV